MTTTEPDQHALHYIQRAHDILDTERTHTTAERDAFRQFRTRCAQFDSSAAPSTAQNTPLAPLTGMFRGQNRDPNGTLQQICDAYRETVMTVAHYDEEYDEPLDENLAAEVGEKLATTITTGEHFSPQLKQALTQAIQQCITSRRRLLDDLAREQEVLDMAETTITEIRDWLREHTTQPMGEYSLTERYRLHETLRQYEAECETAAEARQKTIQTRRVTVGRADSQLFNSYLYASLGVTHPVLAELATLGDLLREARHRLERTLV